MPLLLYGKRPALWPTLITISAVLLALGLGTWQVQRLFWKQGIITERNSRIVAPVLDKLPEKFDPKKYNFRRVRLTGTFLHSKEQFRPARSVKEGVVGYHVFTPLRSASGADIWVTRGWVPNIRQAADTRLEGQVTGVRTLVAVLRLPNRQRMFTPDNQPKRNLWFWLDLNAMAKNAGIKTPANYYFEAVSAATPGGWPRGGQSRLSIRNAHLEYAFTWYSVALTCMVIYLLWHRRRARPDGKAAKAAKTVNKDSGV